MSVPTLNIDGQVATIELQRPDKRNRIEPDDLVELLSLFDQIIAADDVRVVVLAARGPSFCAGFHLGALSEGTRSPVSFGDMCDRLARLPMPTIAQIEGNIHGGGTDLALSCDFRIAAEHIHLLMPAARLGLQYYGSGLQRFVAAIGASATKKLFLTALPADSATLQRVGYLDEVVADELVRTRVQELVAAVCLLGPEAVSRTKAAIDGFAVGTMDMAAVDESSRASMRSAEHREGLRALAEKRPPVFSPSTMR